MNRTRPEYLLLLALCFLMIGFLGFAHAATTIIPRGSNWKYLKGSAEASDPRSDWRLLDFADSGWSTGNLPLGYGLSGLGTTLSDMPNSYSTVFLRKTFTLTSVDTDLRLRALVDWDDGFILWINGERVLDKDEPDGTPLHTSMASDYHASGVFETEELPDPTEYLEVGQNVIAVQLFNKTLDSSDAKIDVELVSFSRVADTKFSHNRGFYDTPFSVTIVTATADATIRYTTDGTTPSATNGVPSVGSAIVSIPTTRCLRAAAFKGGWEPTDVDTQTYLFLEDVLDQPARPAGFPSAWRSSEYTSSPPQTVEWPESVPAWYGMNAGMVSGNRAAIKTSLQSIPTISLVMPVDHWFDKYVGVYRNCPSSQYWTGDKSLFEREMSMEIIYPNGQANDFQINCGIRPHSHIPTSKRGFKIYFRGEYGATKLREPIFANAVHHGDTAAPSFDHLVLRQRESFAIADQWYRDSQISMNGFGARGEFYQVYINGLYWGFHFLIERPDDHWAASYFGGEDSDYFACHHGGKIPPVWRAVQMGDGDETRWRYFNDTVVQSEGNLGSATQYAKVKQYLNVSQYSDYMAVNLFASMHDWMYNNWYGGNRNVPAEPAQYYCWDGDYCWNVDKTVWSDWGWQLTGGHEAGYLWTRLNANINFRMAFADSVYRHCQHGALTEANSQARWDALYDRAEPGILADTVRWADARMYYANKHWTNAASWRTLMDGKRAYIAGRRDRLYALLRTADGSRQPMYPLIDPPEFQQHGGTIGAGFRLTLTNPNGATGSIYYRLDGSDPRDEGGARSGSAVLIASGGSTALTRTTYVKSRVYKSNSTWSAAHACTFNYTAHYPNIKITEIMYNPLGGGDFEFLELKNISSSLTVGLSEMTFSGLRYTFAPGTELAAGQIIVLARNATAFESHYGFAPFGEYAGGLDNGGERIRLLDTDGMTITTVRYNDNSPWPEAADGDGYSLCFEGTGDQDDPLKWRRSNLIGGSPGYDEDPLYDIVINEALTHTDLPQIDAVELYNAGAGSVNIGGWYLSDTVADYKKFQIPSTALSAGDYAVFDETDFGSWALDSHGDEVYLTHWDGTGNLLYLAERAFGGAANGIAFGRHVRTDREVDFVAQSVSNTLGGANAYPLVGPVVINELMYNTLDPADPEYIELYNVSDSAVPLYDPAAPTNGWMLDGAVEYTFSSGDTIAAGEYILVVPTNETAFRAAYPDVPGGVQVFGPYTGRLDNGGESVKLWRPDTPDAEGVPRILVDRVKYDDDSLWVESPDGRGPSLERIAPSLYGNDAANWSPSLASNGTPGALNSGVLVGKTAGWRYHDEGENLGTGWRLAAYDDYGWDDGNAPLGYPDTNPAIDTELGFGDDPAGKYTTTYFRTRFMLDTDPANVNSLTLRARYDDGYVAYLNGQEVARGGMPGGAITHYTPASTANGSAGAYEEKDLASHIAKLAQGVNLLAVEVHQVSASSSDIFMDLELVHTASQQTPAATPTFSPPDGTEFSGASLNVTVSTASSGATVFYTTDGSTPTDTHSDGAGLNSVIVNLTASRTIKARAYHDGGGFAPSAVGLAAYTRILPDVATPSIDPDGGDFYGSVGVTVSTATAGATIFYTTDGSSPSPSNNHGSGQDSVNFTLTTDRTIKARGYKADYDPSTVSTATFTEQTPTVGFPASTETGSESDTAPTLTVTLSGTSAQTIRVDYAATGAGTADTPADYTFSAGTLTFQPGQTTKQIAFTVNDDRDIEGNETIVVQLNNAVNANMGAATLTYTISDNDQLFVAYNDLCWATGNPTQNITLYTKDESGLLVDYVTGEDTPVTLSVTGGGGVLPDRGIAPNSGTDAYDVFMADGQVGLTGLIEYGSNLVMNFSGLDAGLLYEFVLFGNRGVSGYAGRTALVTLSGVQPGFENTSSAGTTISTVTLTDDRTEVGNGDNTVNGHVARYTKIDPGSDGAFVVTVEDNVTKFYANAIMLKALESNLPVSVLPKGATWKYRDTGENLGTAWRAPGYDDGAWSSGQAGLGYPDTRTNVVTVVGYGPDPGNKYITTYYRTTFNLDVDPSRVTGLSLNALYDDGFVAYLNGTELARGGMPTGTIEYDTQAIEHDGSHNAYESSDCAAHINTLVQGENVLAVSIHQDWPTSGDTVMDMELVANKPAGQELVTKIAKGASWKYRKGTTEASDPASNWRTVGFDDAAWASGPAPFGYGPLSYGTTLNMPNNYVSVFLRTAFSFDNPALVSKLTLSVDYDDGFIAWLNGEELARINVQGEPGTFVAHNETCSGYVSGSSAAITRIFQAGTMPVLAPDNVLAVQLFNNALNSGDALFDLELTAREGSALGSGVDTDQDGMPDGWENTNLNGTGNPPDNDWDQDGLLDVEEYVAGTIATNADSFFAVTVTSDAGNVLVSFAALQAAGTDYDGFDRYYALEARVDPGPNSAWQGVPGHTNILGQGQIVVYTNTSPSANEIYRGRVWLQAQ